MNCVFISFKKSHLPSSIKVIKKSSYENKVLFFQVDTDKELAVISVLPQDPPESWSVETRHDFVYLVTTTCNIVFFSEIYSTVYCLDMSPSISAVVNSFNVN